MKNSTCISYKRSSRLPVVHPPVLRNIALVIRLTSKVIVLRDVICFLQCRDLCNHFLDCIFICLSFCTLIIGYLLYGNNYSIFLTVLVWFAFVKNTVVELNQTLDKHKCQIWSNKHKWKVLVVKNQNMWPLFWTGKGKALEYGEGSHILYI